MAYNFQIMLKSIHAQIMNNAFHEIFSPAGLEALIAANLGQDALHGQFGHDEFHFDNNAFEQSYAYLAEQRQLTVEALHREQIPAALAAFGRLTHAAQDFYAHTNYVDLWLALHPEPRPSAPEIDPVDPRILDSADLHSGRLYYPQEALYFVAPLRKFALSFLPRDSHAHMNLDSSERGQRFEYAFQAALKRTRLEFEQLKQGISAAELSAFTSYTP
jgi:hypothetical protein